jgi:hypothetical protein
MTQTEASPRKALPVIFDPIDGAGLMATPGAEPSTRETRLLALLEAIDAHPKVRLPDGLAQWVADEIAGVAS